MFTLIDQGGESPKAGGQLLELRTEEGAVFVRPSRWQRVRLRRAFRYFHIVPPQLMSRSHRRIIAKLLRTAVVTPNPSVAADAVFGVVQNVHATSPAEAPQLVVDPPESPQTLHFLPPPVLPIPPSPERPTESWAVTNPPASFVVQDSGIWPWVVAGAAAAAFIPLIMASVYGISHWSSRARIKASHPAAMPLAQAAQDRTPEDVPAAAMPQVPVLPKKISLPILPTQKHRPAAVSLLAVRQDSETASAEPRFVSELPPGYFAHPVMATPNLVGEVRLKALIGVDGTVKRVTVLSGNPKLARAAMRAVMRWHYSPYQVLGDPVAVETGVKMSFFGPDAVSIASVADGSPTPRK